MSTSPVRLRVAYARPEIALAEYTRSVARRTVSLRSPRKVAVGTKFVFELLAQGLNQPVEVFGEVERVLPLGGQFLVSIRYDPGERLEAIGHLLEQMRLAHADEQVRAHLRVPLNLPAQANLPYSPMFVIRDFSRGGMGITVESAEMPKEIRVGVLTFAELSYGEEKLVLHGEVVWAATTTEATRPFTLPSFGVRFGKLRDSAVPQLDRLLALKMLPPPAITVRLSFGVDAIGRMP